MSFQSCPHCCGSGYEGYPGIPCSVCKGKCIIDEHTGKPPEDKEPVDKFMGYSVDQLKRAIYWCREHGFDLARDEKGTP